MTRIMSLSRLFLAILTVTLYANQAVDLVPRMTCKDEDRQGFWIVYAESVHVNDLVTSVLRSCISFCITSALIFVVTVTK